MTSAAAFSRRLVWIGLTAALAGCATRGTAAVEAGETADPPLNALLDYLRQTGATGFRVMRNGQVLIDEAWPAPSSDPIFVNFVYGHTEDGVLLEDVASQQKSFIAVLAAIAIDRGLLDVEAPVTTYLGAGWSRATREQESAIRVVDLLTMSSGLDEQFGYTAPPGSVFFYNTPVYAATKPVLEAAAGQPLEAITRDWLTAPLGMADTSWRQRPAAFASVGNSTALVTTPRDIGRLGQMILDDGLAHDGARVVSSAQLNALFEPSAANPAYGRLWWLNSGEYAIRVAGRTAGPLIPAAPTDMVAALGALDRRLYVAPSLGLVVVRTGAATNASDFDQQLWLRLTAALE